MKNGENGTESTATGKKVLISTEPSRNFRKKIDKTTRAQEPKTEGTNQSKML